MLTGYLIACSPGTRNGLLLENRKKNKDLDVRLSLNRKKHDIRKINAIGKENIPVEGNWYEVVKN
ncbi:MAG: hypothetical protein K9K32_05875 [Halanaerobiales bacterium]|nr:hypothetical protein [Halanaerobiales bacterium]